MKRATASGNGTRRAALGGAALLFASFGTPSFAQSADPSEIAELRRQIDSLRAEQQQAAARIGQLEAALQEASDGRDGSTSVPTWTASAPSQTAQARSASPVNPAGGSAPGVAAKPGTDRLQLSGDVRVRYESNFGDADARNRDRGVLRARLRATYAVNDWLAVGGQIATGDPDDPNSADVTLSNFNDDLQVSLDQAYARIAFGGLVLHGGKIPQPFLRTELVWDGDVSPQGVTAAYKLPLGGGGATIKATGLYFIVDESVAGPDSDMAGVQVGFDSGADAPWRFELAGAYYDYSLRSLAGGDRGDFRSNLLGSDGRYLSDFDLLNVIGAVTYHGFGERWPVHVVADYVHNFGAAIDQDTGFGVDLLVGRASKRHDVRFGYGYAQAGVDAVLAAFSHDNIDLATNYFQHTALIDFVVTPNVIVNGTVYRYKSKSPLFTTTVLLDDWVNRLRLNLLVNF